MESAEERDAVCIAGGNGEGEEGRSHPSPLEPRWSHHKFQGARQRAGEFGIFPAGFGPASV